MITINGINAKEMWDGYKKGSGERGPFVIKPYLTDWATCDQFIDGILGGVIRVGTLTTRTTRHACPENPTLYATDAVASYQGEDNVTGGGKPNYQYAVVTVTYSVLTWDEFSTQDPGGVMSFPNEAQPSQPILQAVQEIDASSEFITMPRGVFKFIADSTPTGQHVGTWVGQSTLSLTLKDVPYLPQSLLLAKMNKINDAVFLGQPAGQVLFFGAKTHREAKSDGTRTQEVSLSFKWREYHWNWLPRPDTGVWALVTNGSGVKLYTEADLQPLLKI